MKPQDILFIIVLLLLLWKRNPKYVLITTFVCLILAMPLFYKMVFFTAERLVMYAGGFLLVAIILFGFRIRK